MAPHVNTPGLPPITEVPQLPALAVQLHQSGRPRGPELGAQLHQSGSSTNSQDSTG